MHAIVNSKFSQNQKIKTKTNKTKKEKSSI